MIDIKRCVQHTVIFTYARDGALWYLTVDEDLFPVPFEEAASATFTREMKGMYLMRWMRKFNEANK